MEFPYSSLMTTRFEFELFRVDDQKNFSRGDLMLKLLVNIVSLYRIKCAREIFASKMLRLLL